MNARVMENSANLQRASLAGHALAHFASAPVANWADLTQGRPILIIAPHADDETLGCGGLIALTAQRGIKVTVVVMTDGARSHLNSKKYDARARRDMREREVLDAVDILGSWNVDVVFMRQPDGFLQDEGPEATQLVEKLAKLIVSTNSQSVFVTWGADPHPDHAASARIAGKIARLMPELAVFAYPIWGLTLDAAEEIQVPFAPAVRLEIRSALAIKRRAIDCFKSQTTDLIKDDPQGFRLSSGDISRFTGDFEIFINIRQLGKDRAPLLSSVPTEHFEALYQNAADPWQYVENDYEQGRFAATLNALPDAHYRRACEIGCSIGVLTQMLAARCDEILGVDCSPKAVEQAKVRLAATPNASIHLMRVPGQLPDGNFDLIVLSEVLYFFSDVDLRAIAEFVIQRLANGGACVLVNFLGDTESPMGGDQAARAFLALLPETLRSVHEKHCQGFRIDMLVRKD